MRVGVVQVLKATGEIVGNQELQEPYAIALSADPGPRSEFTVTAAVQRIIRAGSLVVIDGQETTITERIVFTRGSSLREHCALAVDPPVTTAGLENARCIVTPQPPVAPEGSGYSFIRVTGDDVERVKTKVHFPGSTKWSRKMIGGVVVDQTDERPEMTISVEAQQGGTVVREASNQGDVVVTFRVLSSEGVVDPNHSNADYFVMVEDAPRMVPIVGGVGTLTVSLKTPVSVAFKGGDTYRVETALRLVIGEPA